MGSVTVLDSTGATQTVNNAVVADGTAWVDATTQHALIGGVYQSSPQTVANNTVAPFLIDVNGKIVVAPGSAEDTTLGATKVISGGTEYETVAASAPAQILGATGAVGDYIEGLLCVVATAATSQVQLTDGNGTAITVLPNAVGGGVGTYYVPLGLKCINATTPGWKVTTAAGVSVVGTGNFT